MKKFTKDQLIARINQVTAINKYRISRDPEADGLAMDNELFAIALAVLTAEPVMYWTGDENFDYSSIHPHPGKRYPFPLIIAPTITDNGEMITDSREMMTDKMPAEVRDAINRLLDSDGCRGRFSAIECHEAHEELERLLAAEPVSQQGAK